MIAEIAGALSAAKSATDLAKIVAQTSAGYENVELKLKAIELVNKVVELHSELLELQGQLKDRDSVDYVDGVYWTKGRVGLGDPYCARCLESASRLVHMREHEESPSMLGAGWFSWRCIDCKCDILRKDKQGKPRVDVQIAVIDR